MGHARPRPWEADESSRTRDSKAPRLDLLAATAKATAAAEVDDLLGRREDFEFPELTGDDDDGCCDHVPTDSAHKDILSWSLLSDDAGTCKDCSCRRREELPKYRRILVCLECGRHSCGDSRSYLPYGHARDHARQEQHWVAALFDDPQTGFCFKCECERPVYPEPDDELGTIASEIQACGGGSHAFGFDMPWHLASDLLNLGDAWRAAELGSAKAHGYGYAIRGIPNRGNTCYMNAVVQCLLALNKLRARMLGLDPPPGDLGMALRELFVEASTADNAGGMLNPDELLRCVRLYSGKYEAYKMHDSYELLESLRNALRDEESGIDIENPYRERGAPTVVDSIFRGEMSETRSCIHCQSASVFHGYFWELSLSLPSKEDLCKSFASSPQTSKNHKSQLLSMSESNNLGKIDARSGDSHLNVSQLNDLVGEKTSDPMEVDSAEEQCTWQSKDVVQDLLYAEEPLYLHCVGFVPHSISDAKVEQMIQMTTDSPCLKEMGPPPLVSILSEYDAWMASGSCVNENGKEIGDTNCIPTIEDCLSLFFKEEVVERSCDCSKVPKKMEVGTNDGLVDNKRHTEQLDMTTCPNGQSSELNSFSAESSFSYCRQQDGSDVESQIIQMADTNIVGANSRMSCGHKETEYHDDIQEASCSLLLNEKQTNLLSTQHSRNLIPPNHELRKQVELDLSANQPGEDQNEQRSGHAIQWPRITKLPSVLILHLKRYIKNGNEYHKNEACVSYKEHLDVGRFTDFSIADKNNSIYHLVGVIEHRGGPCMNVGHYVAYVRARKIGNQQQQSSCSSTWFCADDCNIKEVTLEEVLKCKPYVLFYERMEGKDVSGIR